MDSRASTLTRLSVLPVFIALILNLMAPLVPTAASPTLALAGSSFDATDGNLVVDVDETDWCTPVPNRLDIPDEASGNDDNAFKGNATSENHDVPSLDVDAGAVPGKDDLLRQYIASDTNLDGDLFVYLAWVRESAIGTATVDFELNQSDVVSSNGVTKVRTDGDLLLSFDFQANPTSGGYDVDLKLRTWNSATPDSDNTSDPENTGQWINEIDLDASGLAEGSVNSGLVSDCVSGGTIDTGKFGEAVFNLTDIIGGACKAFGSVLAKTRSSSSSFGNSIQDYITPTDVNFNTCGDLTINKHDANGHPLGGASFSISPNPFGEAADPLFVTDNAAPDDNSADGVIHLSDVEPGEYTVCETEAPDGYIGDPDCQVLTLAANGAATFTFVNTLSAINWTKLDDETGLKLCCASFTLDGIAGPADIFGPITVVDNGLNDEDPDAGELLVSGLLLGTYRITETIPPTDYALPSPAFQNVVLDGDPVTGSPANAFRDPPIPVLVVAKTPDQGSATSGDTTGFTILTTNNGPGTALSVTLTDPLPAVESGWEVSSENWDGECLITGEPGSEQELTCGPEDLAMSQSRSVTVETTLTDSDCDVLNNTATADGSNTIPADDSGSIDPLCPRIDVDKTPDDGEVNAPGTATFSIVTTNLGDGEARDTELFDDLPEVAGGWTIDSSDWVDCAISAAVHPTEGSIGEWLSCGPETIAELGGDNTRTVTVSASVTTDDCGPLNNLVEVTTSNDGSDDDAGLFAVLCPELGIDKETTTPEVDAGEDVNYTVTVSNDGDGPANDVIITDDLPEGITWSETSDDCAIADGTLTCGPMTIAAGSEFSVTVTGTTDAGECPSIENSATFTSSNAGSSSTSETPTEIVVNCPDLELEKTGSDVVVAGDTAFFTLTVTNSGEGDAYDVVLTDDLPNIMTGGWNVTSTTGIPMDNCDVASNTLTCEIALLPSGESFSVTVETPTAASECPSLTNDALVSASNEATDEETQADNTDSHTITVTCPDTSIEKEATTPVVNAGDEATFTITVTAGGSGTNENVTLTDQVHGSALDWSFEVSGDGTSGDCSISASALLLCEFGDLEPEDSVTVVLTYQTNEDDCPSIANSATVSATDDVDLSDNESDEVVITVNCPDVTVDKEPVETPISAGEQGQFTLLVSNDGPGVAYDVEVVDTAPDGTVWTVLDEGSFDCSDEVTDGQQTLTCTLDELAAGASATILIGYTTSQDDCGVLDNDVAVAAGNEPDENTANNTDSATIVVECPGLNLVKTADADPIDAGAEASFTITLWNAGPGDAFDVTLHDELPAGLAWDFEIVSGDATDEDCGLASSLNEDGVQQMSMDCAFETVGVTDMAGGIVIRVFADTDRTDCGTLTNSASADGSNLDEPLIAGDSIEVRCPEITLDKENDAVGSVLPGTTVTYTLTLTVDDGPADGVMVADSLPVGLESPTNISNGGVFDETTNMITWDLGELADGEYTLTYQATVADDVENGEELVNAAAARSTSSQCPDFETLGPECEDDSTVIVRTPTLVIDKVADAELITITGEAGDLEASPSIVTWTLTYTLTNGPVTNAVITDEIPAGFVFLDASDGGLLVDGTVTWTFATLSEGGSVTFRTTVDPETISRVAPTVNVAVIDSDETEPDDGQDSVTVEVEAPPLGGNPTPTPKPELPDTAAGIGPNGEAVTVPLELLVALFGASLSARTLANVKARIRRQ